jgi:hypothetical protein
MNYIPPAALASAGSAKAQAPAKVANGTIGTQGTEGRAKAEAVASEVPIRAHHPTTPSLRRIRDRSSSARLMPMYVALF